ncbi:hypothetical protein BDN72DRAFT_801162, partial [Pluteus cervinus]
MSSSKRANAPVQEMPGLVLHPTDVTVSSIPATKRKIRLELTESRGSAPSAAKPSIIYKSDPQQVELGKGNVWKIDKPLPLISAEVTIRVMEIYVVHADKVVAQHSIPRDIILQSFLKDDTASELEFASPDNKIKIKVKRDSLLDVLHQMVLPQSLMDKLGRTQIAVDLLFGVGSGLSELDPRAKAVSGLLGLVKQQLEQQKVCYEGISNLFDKMARFLPYFERTGEIENWQMLKDVIQKILSLMQKTLQTVIMYCNKSTFAQFAQFVLSEQKERFSQLSTDFDGLLQEYDIAFKTELAATLAKDQVLKYLEKLKPVEISPGNRCLENTRIPVLRELSEWTQSGPDTHSIFWLYGLAGTGKSTIAASFVQWLQAHKMLGAFFTCRRGHKALSSPLQLLQTICYGLSHVHKPYGRLVAQAIDDDAYFGTGIATISTFFQQFFEVPFKSLGAISGKQVLVIVIDALDECGTVNERTELLQCLIRLKTTCSGLKVLITSRANDEIQRALSGCSMLYSIQLSSCDEDIETFFRVKCLGFNFKDSDIQDLVKAAAGLFIWANTACNYLTQRFDKESGLKAILKLVPTSTSPYAHLHQLYETILCDAIPDNVENNDSFQRVLGAILLAVKPLTQDALVEIVQQPNISRNAIKRVVKQLHAVLQCNNNRITVIHLSFAEYLLQHQCLDRFRINTSEQHCNLVDHCIQILSAQLRFNICGFESSYILNDQVEDLQAKIETCISVELQYASVYWVYHYNECGNMDRRELDKRLCQLLQSWNALYWME